MRKFKLFIPTSFFCIFPLEIKPLSDFGFPHPITISLSATATWNTTHFRFLNNKAGERGTAEKGFRKWNAAAWQVSQPHKPAKRGETHTQKNKVFHLRDKNFPPDVILHRCFQITIYKFGKIDRGNRWDKGANRRLPLLLTRHILLTRAWFKTSAPQPCSPHL